MTLLHESIEQKKFDTRMLDKNLARGAVADRDVRAYIEKLPDDSENAQVVDIEKLSDPNTKV